MNQSQLYQVIKTTLTTEKTVRVAEKHRQETFEVAGTANKTQIKEAVEKLFSVKVKAVRVVNIKGKAKRFKQQQGRRLDKRKAYVTLEAGHEINVAEFE